MSEIDTGPDDCAFQGIDHATFDCPICSPRPLSDRQRTRIETLIRDRKLESL